MTGVLSHPVTVHIEKAVAPPEGPPALVATLLVARPQRLAAVALRGRQVLIHEDLSRPQVPASAEGAVLGLHADQADQDRPSTPRRRPAQAAGLQHIPRSHALQQALHLGLCGLATAIIWHAVQDDRA